MLDQSSRNTDSDAWLNTLLLGLSLSGLFYRRIEMQPPIGVRFARASGCAQFHFVAHGHITLRTDDDETHTLDAGDAVLLPRGVAHELLTAPGVASRCVDEIASIPICRGISCVNTCDTAREPDAPAPIRVFSGCMQLDLNGMQPLIGLMPAVMSVKTLSAQAPELPGLLEAMAREATLARAGAGAMLARMADVVAASILRGWVESAGREDNGWLVALRDPQLGRAIAGVHDRPGAHWTVATMAAVAGCSRTVFAERFMHWVGVTPLAYVTALRMRLARQRIVEHGESIAQVAWDLGYASQAAFSRAYKRETGLAPAQSRRAGAPAERVSA